jgi:hypothetical protein
MTVFASVHSGSENGGIESDITICPSSLTFGQIMEFRERVNEV